MNIETLDPLGLYPYQRDIFNAVAGSILNGRGLAFSVEIARQGGKNEVSACLEAALLVHFVESPLNIVKCAPTFDPQAMISLRRLCDCLDGSEFAGDYAVEAGHIVRLGQARVIFLSANDSANVVGNTAHLLLEVDEAQDVSVDKFDRDFRPMAAARNATTVLYGTPWRDGNLLDSVKRRNLELEQVDGIKRHFRYDWEEVGLYNDAYRAYVEGERGRLGEDHPTFRTQYALMNVSSGGGFFSDDQLMKLAGSFPRCRSPRPGATYVAGLDFGGEGQLSSPPGGRGIKGEGSFLDAHLDSTVLTIAEVVSSAPNNTVFARTAIQGSPWQSPTDSTPMPRSRWCPGPEVKANGAWELEPLTKTPSPQRGEELKERGYISDPGLETRDARRINVVHHYAWTGLPFTLLLSKIADIAKGWGLRRLAADSTGLGAPLCASLKQSLGHRVVPVVFSTSSKSDMGYELLAAAGTGRLQLYDRDSSTECDACWHELENAAADYKPNRCLNFYCDPSRSHDDYLMSLALTVEAAARYEPRAAIGRS